MTALARRLRQGSVFRSADRVLEELPKIKLISTTALEKNAPITGGGQVVPRESLRKISQNFSPAGVTSPFVARATPIEGAFMAAASGR